MLTLGTLTLDDDPYVNISYEYNQGSNGRILGGTKKISLTGTIIENSAGLLLSKSAEIQNWFAQSNDRYIENVTINGTTYNFIIVDSVQVDSEDWVTSLSYTINLIAQIESSAILPSNILNIDYNDYIVSLDIAESMTINAEKSNSYFFTGSLHTIQESLSWEIKLSITCRRTSTSSAIQNAHNLLNQILITTPDRKEFDPYKNWNMYLHNRSLDANPTAGSINFSCKILLIPPLVNVSALVSIEGSKTHNYLNNAHNTAITLNATGLIAINWSSIIDLPEFYLINKISNAQNAINSLIDYYKNLNNFPSQDLVPYDLGCATDCNIYSNDICYIPKSINTTKNITTGIMSATLEWSSDSTYCSNGLSIEIEKSIKSEDKTLVEQGTFWIIEPIITNMSCRKANVESWTITVSSKLNCIDNTLRSVALNELGNIINLYSGSSYFLVKNTLQQNNNNCTINCDFVQRCL